MLFFIGTFFLFVLLLLFLFTKIADLTFVFASRSNSKTWNFTTTGASFLASFILSILIVSYLINFLASFSNSWQFSKSSFDNFPMDTKDCPVVIETIYQTENDILNHENHRYIEQSENSITTKILKDKYEKGVKKLTNQVKIYENLNVNNRSKQTINAIATSIKDKANLFKKRTQLNINDKAFQNMPELLIKMDRATQTRLEIISEIKQQCMGYLKK
jgi:hypothetical protein